MTKRIVISGYYGFKNFGDEAILSVLVNKLKQDNHTVTVISSDPEYTKSLYKHIRSVYSFSLSDIMLAIIKSDIVISGGGSLLQDVTSLKSLFYYLFIIFIGLLFRKKVIIYAQGIGPINNVFGRICTKIFLKQCSYVSVRDEKSKQMLQKWGINSDLVCDPIFSTNVESSKKKNTIAIQLRDFKTMSNDFISRLAMAVVKNFSNENIEIYSFQDEIDLNICKSLKKNLQMLNPDININIYSGLNNEEIIGKISKCKYLISMRFHAIIIGLLSKSKILSINYDPKIEKISKEFNLPMIDLKHDFKDEFTQLINQTPHKIEKQFNWSGFDKIINN